MGVSIIIVVVVSFSMHNSNNHTQSDHITTTTSLLYHHRITTTTTTIQHRCFFSFRGTNDVTPQADLKWKNYLSFSPSPSSATNIDNKISHLQFPKMKIFSKIGFYQFFWCFFFSSLSLDICVFFIWFKDVAITTNLFINDGCLLFQQQFFWWLVQTYGWYST